MGSINGSLQKVLTQLNINKISYIILLEREKGLIKLDFSSNKTLPVFNSSLFIYIFVNCV